MISLQVLLRGLGFTCKHAGSALPEEEVAAGVGPTLGAGPIGSIVGRRKRLAREGSVSFGDGLP